MKSFRNVELPPPKRGGKHLLLGVCRISTEHQNEMSLNDQLALYHEWAKKEYPDGYEMDDISSRDSGEALDRAEFLDLSERIDSGRYDCVVTEDLGRMARRLHTVLLCEAGEDTRTRIVAINDRVDTFVNGWKQNAVFASLRHESYNEDTSYRIRRSLRARFATGKLPLRLIAGYESDGPGCLEENCHKNPEAIAIYDEWFDRLDRGQSFAQIADWLNEIQFPVGPDVRKTDWNGTLVGQVTNNSLLKGLRIQNKRVSERNNRTGRRKSVAADDDEIQEREVPHLAFIEPTRYDRIIRKVKQRNARYVNGIAKATNSLTGRTRRDTRWPAQHLRCGICGRNFVLGGHGRKERMMCDGARRYQCWNAMTIDRPDLAMAISDRVRREIVELPEFDANWEEQLRIEASSLSCSKATKLEQLQKDRDKKIREVENLAKAIANGSSSETLFRLLSETESRVRLLTDACQETESQMQEQIVIPTADQIREICDSTFLNLAVESREFGDVMREVVSDLFVLPYRLIDGGHIEPRCGFTLNVSCLDEIQIPDDVSHLQISCRVDLTKSPQRVEFRSRVTNLRKNGMGYRNIAAELGITMPAAQNAAKLQGLMDSLAITDPWVPVRTEADAIVYFKRLKNPRHQFKPMKGFTPRFPEDTDSQ
ncbi:MAG: recombinase family protein [Planctomycetales bacterium]